MFMDIEQGSIECGFPMISGISWDASCIYEKYNYFCICLIKISMCFEVSKDGKSRLKLVLMQDFIILHFHVTYIECVSISA